MKKYRGKARIAGAVRDVYIDANNLVDAKFLLEAQYGKGKVFGVVPVK